MTTEDQLPREGDTIEWDNASGATETRIVRSVGPGGEIDGGLGILGFIKNWPKHYAGPTMRILRRKSPAKAEMPEFQLGVYRHYKGGLYRATALVQHHTLRTWWVVYVSLSHGSMNIRPLKTTVAEPDGWSDYISQDVSRDAGSAHAVSMPPVEPKEGLIQRFAFVGVEI